MTAPDVAGVALVMALALGVVGAVALIDYAAQAARARDWRAAGAYVVVLVSMLAVGAVALGFN